MTGTLLSQNSITTLLKEHSLQMMPLPPYSPTTCIYPAGVDNTETNRRDWREVLYTADGLGQYISGCIMFEARNSLLIVTPNEGMRMKP